MYQVKKDNDFNFSRHFHRNLKDLTHCFTSRKSMGDVCECCVMITNRSEILTMNAIRALMQLHNIFEHSTRICLKQ